MTSRDGTLVITTVQDPTTDARMLLVRCPHGMTQLPLSRGGSREAERAATTLVVLQHYRTTGCGCTREPRQR